MNPGLMMYLCVVAAVLLFPGAIAATVKTPMEALAADETPMEVPAAVKTPMQALAARPTMMCGGDYSSESGTIKTPNYPASYDNNQECVWNIQVPAGKELILTSTHFKLEAHSECSYDSLTIINQASGAEIDKICGEQTLRLRTGTNSLKLVFISDRSVVDDGFSIMWRTEVEECGGIHHQDSGTLRSPNYPGHYNNNEQCTWEITMLTDARMLIDVPVFNVEEHSTCNYDVLEVYDGLNDVKLGSYCGSQPFSLLTNTNDVKIKFKTDGSITKTGFLLNWSELQNECGGNFTQQKGKIMSPNHPENYENNMNCIWYLNLPRSGAIHISVPRMDIEHTSDCRYDSLEIYDAVSNAMLGEGKYCGNDGFVLQTQVSSVKVVFKTDHSNTGSGFVLNWQESAE